jgi:hypothetical protein
MKRLVLILFYYFSAAGLSALPGTPEFYKHFRLLPLPQKIEVNPGGGLSPNSLTGVALKGTGERPVQEGKLASLPLAATLKDGLVIFQLTNQSTLPSSDEGYVLEIKSNQVLVSARTTSGLFYGSQTLSQLIEDATEQKINIPACTITDYPDLSFRAVHLDMKHHIESGKYYYQIIDKLAKVKINAIIVEFEDKLRYRKSPVVGASDAISIEEFQAISRYAKARNIEISPLVQGLGHASFILKHDEYKNLRDNPASDWVFDPLNPETYKLQFSLYEDAIEATPFGKYLHVGGDEVGKLGASELSRKSGMTPMQLQMEWLKRVCDFAKAHHRIPIFWDDMVFKLAGLYQTTWDPEVKKSTADSLWKTQLPIMDESLKLFPENCVYMRWNYDAPDIPGNHHAIDWYQRNHLKVIGATAAQEMWPMMPRENSNFQSIKDFCRISAQKKTDGLLCTAWDDSSPHFETYWRGFYNFAYFSWHFTDLPVNEMNDLFRHRYYGTGAEKSDLEFQTPLEKSLLFWETAVIENGYRHNYPKSTLLISLPAGNATGQWSAKYASRLAEAQKQDQAYNTIKDQISKLKSIATRNHYTLDVMNQINELQVYPAKLLLLIGKYDKAGEKEKASAKEAVRNYVSDFDKLRSQFEKTYEITRILHNPNDYLLDQNQHDHLANATNTTDWMYVYELEMNKAIKTWMGN